MQVTILMQSSSSKPPTERDAHHGRTGNVSLIRSAQSCNLFWKVGSSATLGAGSTFRGTIMANTSISLGAAVTVDGRLLAGEQASGAGAVTLINDTIIKPTCAPRGAPAGPVVPVATPVVVPADHGCRGNGCRGSQGSGGKESSCCQRNREEGCSEEGCSEKGRGEEGCSSQRPARGDQEDSQRLVDIDVRDIDLELHVDLDDSWQREATGHSCWLYGLDPPRFSPCWECWGCSPQARRAARWPHGQSLDRRSDPFRLSRRCSSPTLPAEHHGAARPGCAWSPHDDRSRTNEQ